MRPNRIRQAWAQGRAVSNAWCNIPDAFVCELMAQQGWDAVTVDCQHGLIGYAAMVPMLQAISTTDTVPIVRVSWNAPAEIMKALDAGAYGIICPLINTRAECEAFVGACRYPPAGYRSFGPTRAVVYGGSDYVQGANDEILTFAMIETGEGLSNAEDIARTPGLDGVYVGPSDLGLALLGRAAPDTDEPRMLEAYDRILAACRAAGIRAGIQTQGVAYSQKMVALGFDLVTVGGVVRYLTAGQREAREMSDFLASAGKT